MKLLPGFLLLLVIASCKNNKIPDNFDYGETVNGVYTNNYFGFEMKAPEGWVIQNKEELKQILNEGVEIIGQKNKELAKQIKANQIRSASLFAAFKYKTDSAKGSFNPSFGVVAENLQDNHDIKTGQEYLQSARKFMDQSGLDYTFPGDYTLKKIGNKQFACMEYSVRLKGIDIKQIYYATIVKRFALAVIISYTEDTDGQKLIDLVHSITFK